MSDALRLLWTASRDWTNPRSMWNVLNECHQAARRTLNATLAAERWSSTPPSPLSLYRRPQKGQAER